MSDDEEINFSSENFDPIKALYSQNVEPPIPNVPVLDNLTKFELTSEGDLITKKSKEKVPEKEDSTKPTRSKIEESRSNQPSTSSTINKEKDEEEKGEEGTEESKKGQMAVTKKKKLKNILTRMEDMKGPLSRLRYCMEQRERVKICTRTGHGVRGTLEGFVEAFDKQWNLTLRDVHEVWTTTKTNKSKAPPIVGGKVLSSSDAAFRREMFGIKVPRVAVVNKTKNRVTLERHIDQLLVRGEQIVFIIV